VVQRPEDKVEEEPHVADGGCGFALLVDDHFQHASSWFDNYSNTAGIEVNRQGRFSFEKEVTISSSAQLKGAQVLEDLFLQYVDQFAYIEITSSEF
jgi:hypothetical protein